jgi:hypothetical protein
MRYWDRRGGPLWPDLLESDEVPTLVQERRAVPREVSEEAWKEYAWQGHRNQSHERVCERGGFGPNELAILLYQRCKRLEASLELACLHSQPDTAMKLEAKSEKSLERIKIAFQALRDGREHASSNLYRALAAEFPQDAEDAQ